MDMAVIGIGERGQQRVEHLPDAGNRMAIAGDCAMPRFVGEEARMHSQKRQRGERQHAHGEARSGKQGCIRGGVTSQDECAIHGAARSSGPETTGGREFRAQHAVQAIAVQWIVSAQRTDCLSCDGHIDLPKSFAAWPDHSCG